MSEEIIATTGTEETPAPEPGGLLTGGETPGEGATAPPEPKPESVVPEQYEWKAPEGMTLDESAIAKIEPLAREFGFDNAKANLFAAKLVELRDETLKAYSEQATAQKKEEIGQWVASSKADKEITDNLHLAQAGYDNFAGDGLKSILSQHGLNNHPDVIKHFLGLHRKAIAEGSHVTGAAVKQEKDIAARLFDKSK